MTIGRSVGLTPGPLPDSQTETGPSLGQALDNPLLTPGDMVGDYRIEGTIARGGMGVIYAGIHPVISKRVAIKVINEQYARKSEDLSRFILEARAVNQIGHHNIVDIFAIGQIGDGRSYLVMEYLDGIALHRLLARQGRFRPGELVPIYEQLCDALSTAHEKGFVHRDLKPENIAVLRRPPYPFIKILDFGIAKVSGTDHTAVGTVLGTPEYMAPEQCQAGPIDARVDIYAMGIMLYELVTGRKPFTDPHPLRLMAMQSTEPPKPPSQLVNISSRLEQLILKAMAKDRQQRHASAQEFLKHLKEAVPITHAWTTSLDSSQPKDDTSETVIRSPAVTSDARHEVPEWKYISSANLVPAPPPMEDATLVDAPVHERPTAILPSRAHTGSDTSAQAPRQHHSTVDPDPEAVEIKTGHHVTVDVVDVSPRPGVIHLIPRAREPTGRRARVRYEAWSEALTGLTNALHPEWATSYLHRLRQLPAVLRTRLVNRLAEHPRQLLALLGVVGGIGLGLIVYIILRLV